MKIFECKVNKTEIIIVRAEDKSKAKDLINKKYPINFRQQTERFESIKPAVYSLICNELLNSEYSIDGEEGILNSKIINK